MPNIVMTKLKNQPKDKTVRLKIFDFLEKLAEDDSTYGLRVKKMNQSVDPRARTARIDQSWRAVLYLLEDQHQERTWVFAGAWEHDIAIQRARTLKVNLNEVNGAVELIAETMPDRHRPSYVPAAYNQNEAASPPYLSRYSYSLADLVDQLGFAQSAADRLLEATSEDEILALAETLENAWEQDAAISLAMGESIDAIKEGLRLQAPVVDNGASEDERILRAFASDVSKMQFTFVDDNEELRKIIEEGDFAAWRVFLHPEQHRYASGDYSGPFRLTGGAGTGKTVVILHRVRRLMAQNPTGRVVLTTYTRALAGNLKHDLLALDPGIPIASALGDPGVLIRGVDQLGAAVRQAAGKAFGQAAGITLGEVREGATYVTGNREGWASAVADSRPDLPASMITDSFLEAEYLHVILPARVTSREEYSEIRRPGRGVALDRKKRDEVWSIVERYRENTRSKSSVSYAEVSEIGAAWIDLHGEEAGILADHVLIDEGQDLSPSQWKLLRALVRPGRNDMFIAEDAHQRIYGHPVVLARCGIAIVGRSRRLTLNYRTTAENLAFAVRSLADGEFTDAEGDRALAVGYRSARRGPIPVMLGSRDVEGQLAQVCDLVETWLGDESVDVGSVAVLARTNDRALRVRDALVARGILANHVKSANAASDRVLTLTMHTAKGMEFSRVVLFDISDGVVPSPWIVDDVSPEERDEALLHERSLLYVAASRARDALAVTWSGSPSVFLGGGDAQGKSASEETANAKD
ncbi:3'-5' exonuclease [Microbacterium sp. 179-I 3D4 NHS]|uniref:3'-5' exonuclease n=1 Tax=Microbacterium sp. 179-I 3D4 NHS TaxID=3142381 RepID=UPI00399FAE6C